MIAISRPLVLRRCFEQKSFMGDQVEPRREFIQKHALDVRNLDV
jgi:DNA gyrase/topoisomerase IV subunit B